MHFPVIYYNQSSIAKIQRLFLEEDVIRTTIPTNAILTILKYITHSDFKTANKHSNYKSTFYAAQCSDYYSCSAVQNMYSAIPNNRVCTIFFFFFFFFLQKISPYMLLLGSYTIINILALS